MSRLPLSLPFQGDKDADKPPPMEIQYGTKPKLHKLSKKEVCITFLLAGWLAGGLVSWCVGGRCMGGLMYVLMDLFFLWIDVAGMGDLADEYVGERLDWLVVVLLEGWVGVSVGGGKVGLLCGWVSVWMSGRVGVCFFVYGCMCCVWVGGFVCVLVVGGWRMDVCLVRVWMGSLVYVW